MNLSADLEKNRGQKCSTGQRFIFTEVTFFKIHISVLLKPNNPIVKYKTNKFLHKFKK